MLKSPPWQNKILLHVLRAVLALMTGTGWWLCRHCFCSVESSLAATSAAVSAASATSAAASANRDQLKTACDMPTWEWVPYAECIRGGNFWQAVVLVRQHQGPTTGLKVQFFVQSRWWAMNTTINTDRACFYPQHTMSFSMPVEVKMSEWLYKTAEMSAAHESQKVDGLWPSRPNSFHCLWLYACNWSFRVV